MERLTLHRLQLGLSQFLSPGIQFIIADAGQDLDLASIGSMEFLMPYGLEFFAALLVQNP